MAILRTYHPSSSNLRVTQFNTQTRVMRVLFKSEYLYFFYNVPRSVYDAISDAAPKGGTTFWKRLATKYPYRQINKNNSVEDTSNPE